MVIVVISVYVSSAEVFFGSRVRVCVCTLVCVRVRVTVIFMGYIRVTIRFSRVP